MRLPSLAAFSWGPLMPRRVPVEIGVLFALLGSIALGCPKNPIESTLPALTTDDPEAEAALREAREAADEGRLDEAGRRYEEFLQTHATDPLVPIAELGLGRIALARGDLPAARSRFESIATHADPVVSERGHFYLGIVLHLEGRHAEARQALDAFVGRTVDPEETALLLETLAATTRALGDRVATVETLDRMTRASVAEEAVARAKTELEALVAQSLTADETYALHGSLPAGGYAWILVTERAAREAFAAGQLRVVHDLVAALREHDHPLPSDLQDFAMRAERADEVDPRAIGAVLPLTGRGREVGQLALRGLTLATGLPNDGPPAPDAVRLVLRDSGGDPTRAAQAVDDLVSLHRVIAIIGPIGSDESERVAARARELGVPVLLLSPNDRAVRSNENAFRLLFTPAEEAEALVDAAFRGGARRFVVLHPDHAFGRAMRQAAEASVTRHGAELVRAIGYPADTTSFRDALADLASAGSIDAVLVAEPASRVALVAPALASIGLFPAAPGSSVPNGARPVTLLLPSVAFEPALLRSSGRYLQGALVSVPFAPELGAVDDFTERYRARFASEPETFAAYAYDALRLVDTTVRAGATSRADLVARLRGRRAETVGASSGFRADRGPTTATRILRVTGDRLSAP